MNKLHIKTLPDTRSYEKGLHEAGAEEYEKGVSEWALEHRYFIAGQWGRRFRGLFLDYGCGTGLVARNLVDAGREVVGIDISRAMCEIAKRKIGFEVVVGDCLNLPFRDQAFGVVCASGVLHHLPHQLERALSEIGRCAKQAICLVEPSATPPVFILRVILFFYKIYKWVLDRLYANLIGKYTYSIFERPLHHEKLSQICKKEGFQVSQVRFFNHIPLARTRTFFPENLRRHLVESMLSSANGTDVEIIAKRY